MDAVVLSALARHLLTTFGGVFAARYGIDGGTIDAVVGAIATLAGFGWSFWDKKKAK
jgi:hypothetical protein